ncbi:N-acetyltransferase 9-like protein isoform X1 [Ixodes scapularis]
MRTNAKTEVWSEHLVLVPYQEKHVERYHEWMKDPHLQEMTASEPLSLADEYAMQKSWLEDDDKCTFIVLDRKQYEESSDEVGAMIGDVNLFFNNQDNNREAELEVMIAGKADGANHRCKHLFIRVVTKLKRPPEKKTMRTNAKTEVWSEHLVLVPYQEKHVERYHEWMKDPHLQEMTASEPLSLADEYAMQKSWLEDDDKCTFIVLDRKQYEESSDEVGAMIGDVNLFFNNQDNNREAELEVMIAEPSNRGKGRGKEVLRLMMRYGIEVLCVGLFTAKIKLSNTVSRKLFESQGFILTSTSSIFQEATYSLEVDEQFQARLRDSTPAYNLKLRH